MLVLVCCGGVRVEIGAVLLLVMPWCCVWNGAMVLQRCYEHEDLRHRYPKFSFSDSKAEPAASSTSCSIRRPLSDPIP
jgi:hypothetical protein